MELRLSTLGSRSSSTFWERDLISRFRSLNVLKLFSLWHLTCWVWGFLRDIFNKTECLWGQETQGVSASLMLKGSDVNRCLMFKILKKSQNKILFLQQWLIFFMQILLFLDHAWVILCLQHPDISSALLSHALRQEMQHLGNVEIKIRPQHNTPPCQSENNNIIVLGGLVLTLAWDDIQSNVRHNGRACSEIMRGQIGDFQINDYITWALSCSAVGC